MNDHKYIYEFYIVPENAEIAKVRYPVVYESDKEIVFVRGQGQTKTITKPSYPYQNSEFYSNMDIDTLSKLFNNKDSSRHIYTTKYLDNVFDGKKLYFKLNSTEILMKLDGYMSRANHFRNLYLAELKKYNDLKNILTDKGLIKEDEDGNIKVV